MMIAGKKLDIITLDFETYYETGAKDAYSLRNQKMNTSEYIRDKRFYAQCVGVKKNAGKTVVYPHDQIAGAFASIDWTKSAMLCHNTYFDGFICSHHYNVHPAFYLDTMCMSRAVHGANRSHGLDHLAKLHGLPGKVHGSALVNVAGIREPSKEQLKALSVYCKGDVEDTYALFNLLHEYVPDSELRLIDLTLRMFCRPRMLADIPRLTAEYEREVAEKGEALQRVEEHCTLKQLTSNDQFAELLRAEGIDPPMKPSPADPTKLTYAFAKNDLEFIELMEQGPPTVQALCEARVRNKTAINETRALRLLKAGENKQAVPVMLNYCGAHTFRWSGGNKLNLQNLPRGGELRRSLLAPKGSVLVVADSAQIEARTLAWLAGETQVVQAFASGQDVYKLMAALIYNIPVDQVDKTQRFVGKLCLGEDTLVLTKRGWMPIVKVLVTDLVWDGIEWVKHSGVQFNGLRTTLTCAGVCATPDHEILTEHGWEEWREVLTSPSHFRSALQLANLPYSVTPTCRTAQENAQDGNLPSSVPVVGKVQSLVTTLLKAAQRVATAALKLKPTKNASGNIEQYSQMTPTESGFLIEYPPVNPGAITQKVECSNTTAGGASTSTSRGAATDVNSWHTLSHSLGGTLPSLISIESTSTADMSPEICALFPDQTTLKINEKSPTLREKTPVYDLLSCGPRHRFVIWSEAGPLIVHNCTLGLGYGMGHAKFRDTLAKGAMGPAVEISAAESKRIVDAYRNTNWKITQLWRRAEAILIDMVLGTSGEYGPLKWGKGYIQMPNGLFMQYKDLTGEIYEDRTGTPRINDAWYSGKRDTKTYIYGGLAVENWVQSLARCIVAEQMLVIAEKYDVVTMSHDEIVVIAPKRDAKKCEKFMVDVMSTPPSWAEGLPLGAEAGYDVCYSK